VRGPSVAVGYWGQPRDTAEVFRDGWLNTGDLGYLADGELYVCGRMEDLIIVRGKSYYPQDVERLAANACGVRQDQCVAFARRVAGGSEECVVVCELPKQPTEVDDIDRAVRTRVQRELGISVFRVVLLERNALPKTSSGKVRRRETRSRLERGTLALSPRQPTRTSSAPPAVSASAPEA
jgi:fatty-acyl-CoA synthase